MRQSINQEHDFGCGVACVAFAANIPYRHASRLLGEERAAHIGFFCKELVVSLNKLGLSYEFKYLKPRLRAKIYQEGVIVFIRRSKQYPSGHYLIRHNGSWMDPWINLHATKDVSNASSGFRKRLPGNAVYAIFPIPPQLR